MAKTATKAPTAPTADTAYYVPPADPLMTIWGFTRNAATVTGKPQGFMHVRRSVGEPLIASGDAVLADGRTRYPYREGFAAYPPAVVAITAFSAANPTVATASAADVAKLNNGDRLLLTQTGGAALPAVDGQRGTVFAKQVGSFTLTGIDLSADDPTGVTASGTVQPS
jgi:hypothetical protein